MESVIEAEVKFGFFLAEHYLAFNLADHCSKLFPSLFHDSAIAKAFKCGHTKATAIVNVLALEVMKDICGRLQQSQFFSLHTQIIITVYQQCALMLRFYDKVEGCVRCIFSHFKEQMLKAYSKLSIPIFQAVVPFATLVWWDLDQTVRMYIMLGTRNSVLTRLKEKQPGLVSFHCNCHLAALITNHASKVLPDFLEEVTIQIW